MSLLNPESASGVPICRVTSDDRIRTFACDGLKISFIFVRAACATDLNMTARFAAFYLADSCGSFDVCTDRLSLDFVHGILFQSPLLCFFALTLDPSRQVSWRVSTLNVVHVPASSSAFDTRIIFPTTVAYPVELPCSES